MLYMIVEHFKDNDPVPVYRRFRDRGRLAPDGLEYISSWVDENLEVISSKEAAEKIAPRL